LRSEVGNVDTSDTEIKLNIEAALWSCPQIDESGIVVKVTDGIVMLSGYVRNFFDKYRAEDAVKRVAGVIAIANDIQVHSSLAGAPPDPLLAREAVAAIRRQLPEQWQRIRPIVHQGSVTLEGLVDTEQQRAAAVAAVRAVKGVVCVVNGIGLAPSGQPVRPEYIKRLIEESFRRSAQCDASDVHVKAGESGVTLHGYVHTWAERLQAEQVAKTAPGVRTVRNKLTVRFAPSDTTACGNDAPRMTSRAS
jgi:osmotically-inducible protein OsmY